jgi:DNA-binding MarR family transcriptional regulator
MAEMSEAAENWSAGARWLSEDESRAWRLFLVMKRVLERGLDRQLMASSGLSGADYQLLVPLSEAPDRAMRARDLGRLVDWERSRLSHQIRRMERRGLLARHDCATDARGTVIVLTEEGASAIREAAPAHVAWVRDHFIDVMSPEELALLGRLSERVLEAVVADGACDAESACDDDDGDAGEECPEEACDEAGAQSLPG